MAQKVSAERLFAQGARLVSCSAPPISHPSPQLFPQIELAARLFQIVKHPPRANNQINVFHLQSKPLLLKLRLVTI